MLRVVIDTNVVVSAIVWGGKPRELVLKLLEQHTVILSPQMLAELNDVISRDKFGVKTFQVKRFLTDLTNKSKIVNSVGLFKIIVEDPDDNNILNAAYSGKADYIVTGDKHLLALEKFKRTKIITVNKMLEIIS